MSEFHLIHHMARTGGTVISKCIAAMSGVALLSEIHPKGMTEYHPVLQAVKWHQLVPLDEARRLAVDCPGDFARCMGAILRHAADRGVTLVVRDWNHLDFTGVPYMQPDYRLTCYDALAAIAPTRHAATVRHPVAQWRSLKRLPMMADVALSREAFLVGYHRFALEAADAGFIRYEDFTRDPDGELGRLCAMIGIAFDPGYRQRWHAVETITGDSIADRATATDIRPDLRQPDSQELAAFEGLPLYEESLEILGYVQ